MNVVIRKPQLETESRFAQNVSESKLLRRDIEKILDAYELAEECDKESILAHYEELVKTNQIKLKHK